MPLEHEFFSQEQVDTLYNLAKARGLPVDSMRYDEFINYVYGDMQWNACSFIELSLYQSTPSLSENISVSTEVATLLFDGERLYWNQGKISTSWPAYSGSEEYLTTKNYSVEAQKKKDEGPIPAGWYSVKQDRYQERPYGFIGMRTWPGGSKSWGNHRIWLEPEAGTNTYGRTGMSIHGGDVPGSRGCIDLVGGMEAFAQRFRKYGKDMRLEVRYPGN